MRILSVIALLSCLVVSSCSSGQSVAPVTHYGQKTGPGSSGVHVVASGDTLYSVSQRYDIVMRDIAYANQLSPPFILNAGQRLTLPPPREYRVRSGDSLYEISRLFNVSSSELASINDIDAPYRVYTGQRLRLPSASGSQVAAAEITAAPQVVRVDGIVAPNVKPGVKPDAPNASSDGMVTPDKKPTQSAATQAKLKKASKKISRQTPKRSSSKFLQPVRGKVASGYGPKDNGLHNDGINILAARGTPVKVAENGVVVYAGNGLKESGNLVLVRHEDRWMTAYGHLDRIAIKNGDIVSRGQSIGSVGSTGNVREPQLHFEVRRGTKALNPQPYLE